MKKLIYLLLFALGLGLLLRWMFPARIVWEKLATALAMPAGFLWLLLSVTLIVAAVQRQRLLTIGLSLSWLLLTIGGNTYVATRAIATLEQPFMNFDRANVTPLKTVVVLGGGACANARGAAQFDTAGDRIGLAAELFHAGKVQRIICTGSQIEELDTVGAATGELGATLLRRLGVPAERIETVRGRTTYEEMQSISKLLADEGELGLVTSASHMTRALRLAKSQGLDFTPIPADFVTRQQLRFLPLHIVPTGHALETSGRTAKEYLARIVGR